MKKSLTILIIVALFLLSNFGSYTYGTFSGSQASSTMNTIFLMGVNDLMRATKNNVSKAMNDCECNPKNEAIISEAFQLIIDTNELFIDTNILHAPYKTLPIEYKYFHWLAGEPEQDIENLVEITNTDMCDAIIEYKIKHPPVSQNVSESLQSKCY